MNNEDSRSELDEVIRRLSANRQVKEVEADVFDETKEIFNKETDIFDDFFDDFINVKYDQWRNIPGYGEKYEISRDGTVRNRKRGVLQTRKNGTVGLDGHTVYVNTLRKKIWGEIK